MRIRMQVVMKLGPPMGEKALNNGGSVWIYKYTGATVGEGGGSGTYAIPPGVKLICRSCLAEKNSEEALRLDRGILVGVCMLVSLTGRIIHLSGRD